MANNKMNDQFDFLYKIVMVGEAGVGKTHLLSRYIKGTLPKTPTSTIGVEFATRTVPLFSGGVVKAQVWDTAGQERYRAITCAHYRKAVGALLVFDVTNEKSFSSVKKWMEELREHADPDIVIMLIGNKVDLCERNPNSRKVTPETALAFAKENNLLFYETSAITIHKVREAFEDLLQAIYNVKHSAGRNRQRKDSRFAIQLAKTQVDNSQCC